MSETQTAENLDAQHTQGAEPQVSDNAAQPSAQPAAETDAKKPEYGSWQDRMIASQRRARADAEQRAAAAEAELQRYRAQQQQEQRDPQDPVEIERRAEQRAAERLRTEAEAQKFNEACNVTAQRIQAEFGGEGMQKAVAGWTNAGLDIDRQPAHRELLSLITSIEDGHKLYHAIGNDPDYAAHLLSLPPLRAAFELAKRLPAAQAKELREEAAAAAEESASAPTSQDATQPPAPARPAGPQIGKPPTVSSAPRPPAQPAASRGSAPTSRDITDPKLSMEEYARVRAEQRKARSGR